MSRTVTLVLIDDRGTLLGALPPYEVPTPWWPDVHDVVARARQRHRLDVTVLRLLAAERPAPPGGAVTYLAEVADLRPGATGLSACAADLAPHPARAPWAEPGGPARSLAWATAALAAQPGGAVRPVQQRTWNLSAIWRLDHAEPLGPPRSGPPRSGPPRPAEAPAGWLKQVPRFFAHEAAVLRWLGDHFPRLAPALLAADQEGRLLLGHVAGEDRHGAGLAERQLLAADLHEVQVRGATCAAELVAAGVPDQRALRLAAAVRAALVGHGADLGPVAGLLDGLEARLAAVAGRGLPDTLVHGDLHPGNARVAGSCRVILDWGDSFIGHPAFDILRLADGLPDQEADELVRGWAARWRASVPGCEPERAVALLRPVAALRNAAVYARFLAQIEPSEWPYHAADVPSWLANAAAQASADHFPAG